MIRRFTVLTGVGLAVLYAAPAEGTVAGIPVVKDAAGEIIATAAATGRRLMPHIADSAPPLLRDACRVLVLAQFRKD